VERLSLHQCSFLGAFSFSSFGTGGQARPGRVAAC